MKLFKNKHFKQTQWIKRRKMIPNFSKSWKNWSYWLLTFTHKFCPILKKFGIIFVSWTHWSHLDCLFLCISVICEDYFISGICLLVNIFLYFYVLLRVEGGGFSHLAPAGSMKATRLFMTCGTYLSHFLATIMSLGLLLLWGLGASKNVELFT